MIPLFYSRTHRSSILVWDGELEVRKLHRGRHLKVEVIVTDVIFVVSLLGRGRSAES